MSLGVIVGQNEILPGRHCPNRSRNYGWLRSVQVEFTNKNILVLGSGFSFHNQNAFFGSELGAPDQKNDAFQDRLIETCTGSFTQEERERRLIEWKKTPSARYCHTR